MTITMYGADWCGDCRRAKAWFAANEVDYDFVDLESTPDAVDIVVERNAGVKRIPVIVFDDDTHLTEPSDAELAAKVASLADPVVESEPSEQVFTVVDDGADGRFVLRRDGETVGFAVYRRQDDAVVIPHVETLVQHRGQGYGARLMDGLLDIVRADGHRVVPLCPFAAAHIADNDRFQDLLG
ncbi:MAG: GNAT family N-acetyltransferase [Acidimicrobiales bacterium]